MRALPMPPKLVEGLSAVERRLASHWWSTIDDETRAELLVAWSPRGDSCSYGITTDGALPRWRRLSIRVVAEPELDEPDEDPDAPDDLYEYLVSHELEYISDAPRFHICTRHQAGRDAGRTGTIPAGFECPRRDSTCPLGAISALAEGRRVRFFVRCELLPGPVSCWV